MDADRLGIVGADLRLTRKPHAVPIVRTTATGAAQGALLGLLAGVFVTLVAETSLTGLVVVVSGLVYGVLIGALWGFLRALVRNRPDAVSTEVVPTHYEVRCPVEDLSVARKLLATTRAADDETPDERTGNRDSKAERDAA